jgi:hypothetical protein
LVHSQWKFAKNKLISFMIVVCPSVYIDSNISEITEEIFTTFELWKFTKFCWYIKYYGEKYFDWKSWSYVEYTCPVYSFCNCMHVKVIRQMNSCSQYSETNMVYLLFNLLRIKGLYMLRALLTHPQEALHKRHLVYYVRVMSVGCTNPGAANWHNKHAIYQVLLI